MARSRRVQRRSECRETNLMMWCRAGSANELSCRVDIGALSTPCCYDRRAARRQALSPLPVSRRSSSCASSHRNEAASPSDRPSYSQWQQFRERIMPCSSSHMIQQSLSPARKARRWQERAERNLRRQKATPQALRIHCTRRLCAHLACDQTCEES